MACNIVVLEISGQASDPGQGLSTLTVRGTASECDEVCVRVQQTQPVAHLTPERTGTVGGDGAWSVTFSIADGDFSPGTFFCGPNNKSLIEATCCNLPDCVVEGLRDVSDIRCDEEACNIVIDIHTPDIQPSDPCNPDNTRTVQLSATVTPGSVSPVVVSLEVESDGGDVTYGPAGTASAASFPTPPWEVNLTPGEYVVRVKILSPVGCPEVNVPLSVPPCNTPSCDIAWTANIASTCVDGTRDVAVTVTISTEPGLSFSGELFDSQDSLLATGDAVSGVLVLTSSPATPLAPGDYEYRIALASLPPSCPDGDTNTFTVPLCDDEDGGDTGDGGGDDGGDGGGGGGGDGGNGGGGNGGRAAPPWCFWLRIVGLLMFIVGLVLIWGGMCSSNFPVAIIGGLLSAGGFGLLLLWALVCAAADGGCLLLTQLIQFLGIITIVLGIVSAIFGVIAAICAVTTSPTGILEVICAIPGACGLGAVIDLGVTGVLVSILTLVYFQTCNEEG